MRTSCGSHRCNGKQARPIVLAISLALGGGTHAAETERIPMPLSSPGSVATITSPLATTAVFNCADSGPGSLRDALLNATDGATIDLTQLSCSLITVESSELAVPANNLTLNGPGRNALQIYTLSQFPFAAKRTFHHSGNGTFTVQGITVDNGVAIPGNGGCILSDNGNVTVIDSRFFLCVGVWNAGGSAIKGGGAIYAGGDIVVRKSDMSKNYMYSMGSRSAGGAVFAGGNVVISDSTFYHNGVFAQNNIAYGGAVAANRDVNISGSTLYNNSAGKDETGYRTAFAGAVDILDYYGTATATITNSTMSGNQSIDRVGGVVSAAPLVVQNSTIAFNTSVNRSANGHPYAAGVLVYASALTLQSTIIANNFAGGNLYDLSAINAVSPPAGADNLIMGSSVSPPGTMVTDPQLIALADNGGPTRTHALDPASHAIGKGNDTAGLLFDQRGAGYARTFARKTDIGAFQSGDSIFNDSFEPLH